MVCQKVVTCTFSIPKSASIAPTDWNQSRLRSGGLEPLSATTVIQSSAERVSAQALADGGVVTAPSAACKGLGFVHWSVLLLQQSRWSGLMPEALHSLILVLLAVVKWQS